MSVAYVDRITWRFVGYPLPTRDGQTYPAYETTWPEDQAEAARFFYDKAATSRSWLTCELTKDTTVTMREVVASTSAYWQGG